MDAESPCPTNARTWYARRNITYHRSCNIKENKAGILIMRQAYRGWKRDEMAIRFANMQKIKETNYRMIILSVTIYPANNNNNNKCTLCTRIYSMWNYLRLYLCVVKYYRVIERGPIPDWTSLYLSMYTVDHHSSRANWIRSYKAT